MLSPTTTTTTAEAKQIVILGSAAASAVVYTVPSGKKFIGYLAKGNTAAGYFIINGINTGSVYLGTAMAPITLVAGTTVAFNVASEGVVLGVEYDA